MRLALAEIRRAKLRFGLLIGAVALLVSLILFQQTHSGSLGVSTVTVRADGDLVDTSMFGMCSTGPAHRPPCRKEDG